VLVPENSEARFRVREQLAGASLPNDAIGRTKDFTGTLVINRMARFVFGQPVRRQHGDAREAINPCATITCVATSCR